MVIIEKIEDRDGRYHFQDKETKVKYARIIAGLGWPGVKPAFVAVVAEDFDEDRTLKVRHVHVLAEVEEPNFENFFKKCLDLRERYQVEDFYGNSENKAMMEFLNDFNRKLPQDQFPLRLGLAPFPEELSYHVFVIRERLEQGRRTLHFDEKSLLKGDLMEIGKEEIFKSVTDYPPIAALGYALSHIKSSPFTPWKPWRRNYRGPSSWRTV